MPGGLSSGAASRPPTTGGGTGTDGEAEEGDAEDILKAEVQVLAEEAFKAQRRLVDERLAVEVKGVMDEVRSDFIFQMKACAISYVPRARDGENGKGGKTFKHRFHLCWREARVWGAPVKKHCVCVCWCMLVVCVRVAAGCVLSYLLRSHRFPLPIFRFSLSPPVSLSLILFSRFSLFSKGTVLPPRRSMPPRPSPSLPRQRPSQTPTYHAQNTSFDERLMATKRRRGG